MRSPTAGGLWEWRFGRLPLALVLGARPRGRRPLHLHLVQGAVGYFCQPLCVLHTYYCQSARRSRAYLQNPFNPFESAVYGSEA
jgi:hypothetical protein